MRGHQPFFLAAAAFAIGAMLAWLGVLELGRPVPGTMAPAQWHAHEMLFGYTSAVLAGFLLTGSSGWRPLLGLALWLGGRVAIAFAAELPAGVVAALDLAFLPLLALLRTPPLWSGFKWPTVGFLPLLGALLVANLLWHLDALGILAGGAGAGLLLALDLFTLMIVVMAGRLVPGYTRAMLIPVRKPKDPGREQVSVALGLALLVFDQLGWTVPAGAAALALAGMQAWRLAGWRTRDVMRRPLLLVLHLGFAWLVAALALRGLASVTLLISPTDAIHALTVGAIGTLTLAMMGRLARVHGRRPLAAGPLDLVSYGLIFAAALARAALPPLVPALRDAAVEAAALLWMLAFLCFLAGHGATLLRAGRPEPATPLRAAPRG